LEIRVTLCEDNLGFICDRIFNTIYICANLIALAAAYPEHKWSTTPFWKDKKNQREFMDKAAKTLGVQKIEDWYKVSYPTVIKMGGTFIERYYKSSVINGTSVSCNTNIFSRECNLP
jgi:hypothetical protein